MNEPRPAIHSLRTRLVGWTLAAAAGLTVLGAGAPASAAVDKTLCVFDPGGKNGDIFARMQDYKVHAVEQGVNFTLKAYTDESVAASDFRNKACDAVVLTGLTGKEFNPTTYTVEAMGLFDNYDALGRVVSMLANPKAAPLNQHRGFENAGIYPAGAVYLYLRDRGNASLARLSGRSIAWIGADPAAQHMINQIGAAAKQAEVSTFASMFNNGSVDACYGPATAYQPLELRRGIGKGGGVVRFPIAQLTFQVFLRGEEFPAGFAQASRSFVSQQFASMLGLVRKAEDAVASWIEITPQDHERYSAMLAGVRDALKATGVYNADIIRLARK